MKTPTDQELRQLLRRSWTVSVKANPGFRAAVWARIEARRPLPATWGGWLRLNFARVTTYAIVSITLASAGGGLVGIKKTGSEREQWIQRYIASIDPHQRMDSRGGP